MTERHTALYRLLSKSGRLLYVGISGNPDSRWGTHSNNQPWWEEVADRKIEWFGSREAAAAAEVEAIKEERPLYNKQHSVIGTHVAVPVRSTGISEPLEDPWADSGPGDRLPVPRRRDGGPNSEHAPPQDFDAEQSVLGCMLRSNEAAATMTTALTVADFHDRSHQTIYGAILDLRADGHPADRVTVAAALTKRGEIADVGGMPYLCALIEAVPALANVEYYAAIVYERAVHRRVIEAARRLTNLGRTLGVCAAKVLELAEAEIAAVAGPLRSGALGLLTHDEVYAEPTATDEAAASERPATTEETP